MAKFKSDLPVVAGIISVLYGFVVLLFVFHTTQFNILFQNQKRSSALIYFFIFKFQLILFISLCGYAYWKTEK
jgi:hypothetical protein